MMTTDFFASWKPARASARTELKATSCSSSRTNSLWAGDHRGGVVEELPRWPVLRLKDLGHDRNALARREALREIAG